MVGYCPVNFNYSWAPTRPIYHISPIFDKLTKVPYIFPAFQLFVLYSYICSTFLLRILRFHSILSSSSIYILQLETDFFEIQE